MYENKTVLSLYKYDKNNRIESEVRYNISWGCEYKYNRNYRKIYFYSNSANTRQILKQELINDSYEKVSSLVDFNDSKYYAKYLNGKEIYTKFFNKNKSTFEKKTLLKVGDSSITEITFNKNGKKQKQIQITTKQNGKQQ